MGIYNPQILQAQQQPSLVNQYMAAVQNAQMMKIRGEFMKWLKETYPSLFKEGENNITITPPSPEVPNTQVTAPRVSTEEIPTYAPFPYSGIAPGDAMPKNLVEALGGFYG